MKIMPLFFGILMLTISCTKKNETPSAPFTPDQMWDRGRSIYLSSCASCHNANPKLDGAIGPAVFGANLELLTAKVIHGKYPEGYTPKRTTSAMLKLPHLEKELSNLLEFLNREKANP